MEEWEEVDIPMHPIIGGRWVAAVVEIRCNATGEVREYETQEVLREGRANPDAYIWSEGNYSCDCNRRLFFTRAAGGEGEDGDCSEGLYSVRVRNKRSRRAWYSEFIPKQGHI